MSFLGITPDTAEMTHAFAIGCDWLYPVLSSVDRPMIRTASSEKRLVQALSIYREHRWWSLNGFN